MLTFSPTTRIYVARDDVSFIGGIDRLAAVCRQALGDDPMSGAVFVFRNRRRTMMRLLFYDGQGYILATKRLSIGRFRFWPTTDCRVIAPRDLSVLLSAGDPRGARFAEDWRGVNPRSLPSAPDVD